jgi:hypothetical protein
LDVLSRHRTRVAWVLAGTAAVVLLASTARGATPSRSLPTQIPAAARARLQELANTSSVSASASAEPFLARHDVLEFLLDHPELATHLTRTLRLGRYRVWRVPDGGLWFDDGWGVVGQFTIEYAAPGTRVVYARGRYKTGFLPSIQGQAVVVLEYRVSPAEAGHSLVSPALTGFVKLDSNILALAGRLAGAVATAKAEKEARRLVKMCVSVSRAIDENPAQVLEQLRQRPDVPRGDLEEFRRLLRLP